MLEQRLELLRVVGHAGLRTDAQVVGHDDGVRVGRERYGVAWHGDGRLGGGSSVLRWHSARAQSRPLVTAKRGRR